MLAVLRQHSAEATISAATSVATNAGVVARDETTRRAGASRKSRVAAKHSDARAVLRTTEGNHVLTDVGSNNLAMMGSAVREDVLDEVITELITGD